MRLLAIVVDIIFVLVVVVVVVIGFFVCYFKIIIEPLTLAVDVVESKKKSMESNGLFKIYYRKMRKKKKSDSLDGD